MAKKGVCTRCSASGYMMARLETNVVASDLSKMDAPTCISCTVILWDWLQEHVTPLYVLGGPQPHYRQLKNYARLHIWSNANQASRKWHSWFISTEDAERVLDFLTTNA